MKKITPHLWFDKQAKEAAEYYVSVFPDSKITSTTTLPNTPGGDTEIVSFELNNQPFMAMSAGPDFKFNEAVSFIVYCETQKELDYYWEKLSASPENEQCGWCKDKFGLSWQIVPTTLDEMLTGDEKRIARVTQAVLAMKKLDFAELEKAANGE